MAEEPGEDTSPVRVVYMFYDTVGRRPVCLDAEVYHDEVKKWYWKTQVSGAHTPREQQAQLVAIRVIVWHVHRPGGWRDSQRQRQRQGQ